MLYIHTIEQIKTGKQDGDYGYNCNENGDKQGAPWSYDTWVKVWKSWGREPYGELGEQHMQQLSVEVC